MCHKFLRNCNLPIKILMWQSMKLDCILDHLNVGMFDLKVSNLYHWLTCAHHGCPINGWQWHSSQRLYIQHYLDEPLAKWLLLPFFFHNCLRVLVILGSKISKSKDLDWCKHWAQSNKGQMSIATSRKFQHLSIQFLGRKLQWNSIKF